MSPEADPHGPQSNSQEAQFSPNPGWHKPLPHSGETGGRSGSTGIPSASGSHRHVEGLHWVPAVQALEFGPPTSHRPSG
jgi:hypothetical protein